MEKKLIEQCYLKSVELLKTNSAKEGFRAATAKGRALTSVHYHWLFGRDSSICSLGAIASNNKELIKIARRTLITLARQQTKRGQIPNALNKAEKKVEYYYLNSVDGTLWWLIAIWFYRNQTKDKKLYKLLNPRIKNAITWLKYQTGGTTNLIVQAEACDWADLMPRSGHVLYSNVLWYWVQKLYKLKGMELTKTGLNSIFYPFGVQDNNIFFKKNFLYKRLRLRLNSKIKPTDFYLSHVSVNSAGRHCDVYGNILALLLGLPNKKLKQKIITYLIKEKVNLPYPVKVTIPPIIRKESEWSEMLEHENRNLPFYNQNGGVWPFIGSFYAMALKKIGKTNMAWQELGHVAQANQVNNWQFNEWFHGQTGKPMGMPGQSWNAGTYILAYHYLKGEFKFWHW